MELEEAIEILKEFKKTGYHTLMAKYNWDRIKANTMIEIVIETVLNHLTKQEKMIELMALAISSYDGQLVINQYKDRNDVKAKFEEYVEDGTYEQYFEKKAEEDL